MPLPLALVLALLVAAACPRRAEAQSFQLKIGGGLAALGRDSRSVGAYKIGVAYEYEFDQHWTVSPALAFCGKGHKLPDETVVLRDDAGQPLLDEETGLPRTGLKGTSVTADYVELALPFSYYLRLGAARYLVCAAGPFAAVGVAGKHTVRGDTDLQGAERFFSERATFSLPGVRRFDAGLQAAVACQFSRRLTLGVETELSLTRFTSGGGRRVAGLLTLAYRFRPEDFRPQKRKNHYF